MIATRLARRPRRIAADEAHAWARNLRLRNNHAKMVLTSLTLYVDGDGFCFVAIPSLAEDCELSADTVRRRLVWLEEIGAVARMPQWIDDRGVRNGDARGKRTSDLIRLMIDADAELIEARARGETVADDGDDLADADQVGDEISPSCQPGLNPADETVSPTPALRQPSHCCEGLISEPEPESSPQPPSGGACADDIGKADSEPEQFAAFRIGYPQASVWDWPPVLALFAALSEDDRNLALAALPLWAADIAKARIKPMNPRRWLARRMFANYPHAKLPPPPPPRLWIGGADLAGLQVAYRIANRRPPLVRDPERGEGLWRSAFISADLEVLQRFADDDPEQWPLVPKDSRQFAAWRERLRRWTGYEIEPVKVFCEPHDPAVHGLPPSHPGFRLRKAEWGLRVPTPWPPLVDGTFSEALANEGRR